MIEQTKINRSRLEALNLDVEEVIKRVTEQVSRVVDPLCFITIEMWRLLRLEVIKMK